MSSHLSIQELQELYRKKELSPVEHTQAAFEKIEKTNPDIRAFVQLTQSEALEAARRAEENFMKGRVLSPLQGITVGLKDVIHTRDAPVTMETELYYENPIYPKEDSAAAARLREAGAILLGKTNTHEMGMGPTGDVGYSGHARNPYNPEKVTGGSSSGSAAAIAAGLCDVTLGSDTGGSVRLPSALSGTVGMKPTFGRVSNFGFSPLSYSCDTIGPMTKTIADNAHVLQVISGFDPRNMYSRKFESVDFTRSLTDAIAGKKMGVPFGWLEELLDDQVRTNFLETVDLFESLGAEIVDLTALNLMPSRQELDELRQAHQTVLISEAYHAHQPELKYPEKFAADIYQRLQGGNIRSLDFIHSYARKQELMELYQKIYETVSVMLTPSVMLPACDLYQKEVSIKNQVHSTMKVYTEFTWMDSFSGSPSLNVPSGFTADGLPLGVLLNGPYGQEAVLYQFGHALEKALDLKLLPGRN